MTGDVYSQIHSELEKERVREERDRMLARLTELGPRQAQIYVQSATERAALRRQFSALRRRGLFHWTPPIYVLEALPPGGLTLVWDKRRGPITDELLADSLRDS